MVELHLMEPRNEYISFVYNNISDCLFVFACYIEYLFENDTFQCDYEMVYLYTSIKKTDKNK